MDPRTLTDDELDQLLLSGETPPLVPNAEKPIPKKGPEEMTDAELDQALLGGSQEAPEAEQLAPSRLGQDAVDSAVAFGAGVADEVALEYLPQVIAGAGSVVGADGSYAERRDAVARKQAELEEKSPYAYQAGEFAGGAGMTMLLGGAGKAMQGASKLTRLQKMGRGAAVGAKGGGLYGLLSNPGDTEGVVDPVQPVERLGNAALGAGLGGLVGGAAPAVPPVARKIGGGLKFAKDYTVQAAKASGRIIEEAGLPAKIAQGAQDAVDFLARKGVIGSVDDVPEDIIFGKHSKINKLALRIADGTAGDAKKEARAAFINDLDNAISGEIAKIGNGSTPDAFSAGQQLIKLWDKNVDDFFKSQDVTYSALRQNLPRLGFSDSNVQRMHRDILRVEKEAMRRSGGFAKDPAEAAETLKMVNAIRHAWQSKNGFGDMITVLQNIGRAAFSGKNPQYPVEHKQAKELYHIVKNVIEDRVGDYDGELAKRLKYNNAKFEAFFKHNKHIVDYFQNDPIPEKIFINLIQNGNSRDIAQIKRMLSGGYSGGYSGVVPGKGSNLNLNFEAGKDSMAGIKAAYLDGFLKELKAGNIDYQGTVNKLKDRKTHPVFRELFKGEEKALADYFKLLEIGSKMGPPSLNPSGTETTRRFGQFFRDVKNTVEDEALLETLKKQSYQRYGGKPRMWTPPMPKGVVPPVIRRGKP